MGSFSNKIFVCAATISAPSGVEALVVSSILGSGTQFTLTIAMPNQQQSSHQRLLAGLNIVYYYDQDTGEIVQELEYLGAKVICQQDSQQVMNEIKTKKVDMVMFSEDILPKKAELLARRIRHYERGEKGKRTLLVYWYSQHQARYVDNFEYGLKAAGVDYCHSATYDNKALRELLKRWLVWT